MPDSFIEELNLPGWSQHSIWGYDELMDSYFAQLWPDGDPATGEPVIWIMGVPPIRSVEELRLAIRREVDQFREVSQVRVPTVQHDRRVR